MKENPNLELFSNPNEKGYKTILKNFAEKSLKVLRIAGAPVIFASFLNSCQNAPNYETLKQVIEKNRDKIETVDSRDISKLKQFINIAKNNENESYVDEANMNSVEIDTVANHLKLRQISKTKDTNGNSIDEIITSEYGVSFEGEIVYVKYIGEKPSLKGLNYISKINLNQSTGIITGALHNQGIFDMGYYINPDGQIYGDLNVAHESHKDFTEDIKVVKDVLFE